jgi:hypothetical protein
VEQQKAPKGCATKKSVSRMEIFFAKKPALSDISQRHGPSHAIYLTKLSNF